MDDKNLVKEENSKKNIGLPILIGVVSIILAVITVFIINF